MLTCLQVIHPLANFQYHARRFMAQDAVTLKYKRANAAGFPEVHVGTNVISAKQPHI